MMNENLTNSFFTSRLFLDACKLWQEQQDTGTPLKCIFLITASSTPIYVNILFCLRLLGDPSCLFRGSALGG